MGRICRKKWQPRVSQRTVASQNLYRDEKTILLSVYTSSPAWPDDKEMGGDKGLRLESFPCFLCATAYICVSSWLTARLSLRSPVRYDFDAAKRGLSTKKSKGYTIFLHINIAKKWLRGGVIWAILP